MTRPIVYFHWNIETVQLFWNVRLYMIFHAMLDLKIDIRMSRETIGEAVAGPLPKLSRPYPALPHKSLLSKF